MNKTVIGIFGFIFLLVAIALPFLGLEKANGDILPLLVAFLAALISGGFLVMAIKPEFFRRYLIGASALVGLLVVVGVIGLFASF